MLRVFCLIILLHCCAAPQHKLDINYNLKDPSFHTQIPFQSISFFNDNLTFYNTSVSCNSSLKILGESISGAAAGFGGAMLIKNMFKYDMQEAELGNIIQLTLIALGAMYGNTAGVYLFGRIMGDEGSLSNTFLWSIIGSAVFYSAARLLTDNPDKRIISAAAGLPVGAVIGFNSNHIGEIISSIISP